MESEAHSLSPTHSLNLRQHCHRYPTYPYRARPSRLPCCYVCYVFVTTNKYKKYKSVELADQLTYPLIRCCFQTKFTFLEKVSVFKLAKDRYRDINICKMNCSLTYSLKPIIATTICKCILHMTNKCKTMHRDIMVEIGRLIIGCDYGAS